MGCRLFNGSEVKIGKIYKIVFFTRGGGRPATCLPPQRFPSFQALPALARFKLCKASQVLEVLTLPKSSGGLAMVPTHEPRLPSLQRARLTFETLENQKLPPLLTANKKLAILPRFRVKYPIVRRGH